MSMSIFKVGYFYNAEVCDISTAGVSLWQAPWQSAGRQGPLPSRPPHVLLKAHLLLS